jgi:hypothetical protein
VAQGEGPEIKPQYHKKKEREREKWIVVEEHDWTKVYALVEIDQIQGTHRPVSSNSSWPLQILFLPLGMRWDPSEMKVYGLLAIKVGQQIPLLASSD